jgi:hypothetical protein
MEEQVLWSYGMEPQQALDVLACREIHDYREVGDSLRAYPDLDPHEALTSQDPILRAFAIIDRRVGKRTLKKLMISEDEHSLVRVLYSLRSANVREQRRRRQWRSDQWL